MINIVNLLFADIYLDKNFHRIDDVVLNQSKVFYVIFIIEFLIELVASDASKVIAALAEEH